ncbi:hypothetical protein BDB00DRAFT_562585 [Zychaea mexicana]|uniref:uncharacterized protein n=1 Tax=Zychaea mexicana TaxID=64656 RepID=UPI0022FDF1B9|nr:uncharacterized protein BDB00DRAFT_562585 [Zychaea mexicana]KAI9490208.1 hypothetical protein BDB00DRAFT_562585 [Zychaea mexicana]
MIGWLDISIKILLREKKNFWATQHYCYGYPTPISLGYPSVPMAYPVPPPPPTATTRFGYCPDQMSSPPHHRSYHPGSPDSESASSSSKSPQTPSATTAAPNTNTTTSVDPASNNAAAVAAAAAAAAVATGSQQHQALVTPLVPSSSPRYSNPTTDRVKETIARANSVPMEFYHTEFLEYSKETYERKIGSRNKRKRQQQQQQKNEEAASNKKQKLEESSCSLVNANATTTATATTEDAFVSVAPADDFDEDDIKDDENLRGSLEDETDPEQLTSAELRRQIHIQSEQKRRAQIKDGFDELRKHLPGCNNKKMSKAALLNRTVQQMQHLKAMQVELLEEVERLMQENENLKKFQHDVFQRQAMEKMYTF